MCIDDLYKLNPVWNNACFAITFNRSISICCRANSVPHHEASMVDPIPCERKYLQPPNGDEGLVRGFKAYVFAEELRASGGAIFWELRRVYDLLQVKLPMCKWLRRIQLPRLSTQEAKLVGVSFVDDVLASEKAFYSATDEAARDPRVSQFVQAEYVCTTRALFYFCLEWSLSMKGKQNKATLLAVCEDIASLSVGALPPEGVLQLLRSSAQPNAHKAQCGSCSGARCSHMRTLWSL